MSAPRLVIFDVNETMFSLHRLEPVFAAVGLDPATLPLWFARTLRDGFALCAAGDYRPFAEVATATLRGLGADVAGAAQILGAFRELDPHPDVEPALRLLVAAGVRVATLTVGSAEVTGALLARAGLSAYVEQCLSADAVRRWKPAREPYLYAVEQAGVAPGEAALVAAHSWDVHGARRAGLRTGWVSRLEGVPITSFAGADVRGDTLDEVVSALLAD